MHILTPLLDYDVRRRRTLAVCAALCIEQYVLCYDDVRYRIITLMLRLFTAFVLLLNLNLGLSVMAQSVSSDVLKDLAPTGKLRAAINFGNGVLAQKGPNGDPRG